MSAERLFELALRRLVRRERSLSEMREYLQSKSEELVGEGGSADWVEQVLQKLVTLRYVDDERMAAAIIRDHRQIGRAHV